ncbi:LPS biosynthesis protein WbpG [Cytophagales bacterium WSM2-2]|nr:LPS biosynthesis protein WbpG [Cytophagales bacterium WSM2-2]
MVLSKDDPEYRQCTFTVMDNIADPDIKFDGKGICNYYYDYKTAEQNEVVTEKMGLTKLEQLVNQMKEAGKGNRYDCIIGLSGGVDSTYVAYLVTQFGLRPLAVHLDNGWNSELAVKNIENIVNKLNIDLYTIVVDWIEFRDIQLSYLNASVIDIEIVSDHAILAAMYKLASEKKIGFIVSGTNVVTEHIMPPSWIYRKMDYANLKNIHDIYGKVKLKTYPYMDFKRYVYYSAFLKLNPISILNYVPYDKKKVKQIIAQELDWRDYGGKHHESLFTKFYQAYILPQKFKVDKRKPHLSTLICSSQLGRDEALRELEKPLYDENELTTDKEYVLKKLGLSHEQFEAILLAPSRSHLEFKSDIKQKQYYMKILQKTQKLRTFFR